MRRTPGIAASIAVLLFLAACGGSSSKSSTPVSAQSVSTSTVAMTTPIVRQLVTSLGAIGSDPRLQELLTRLGGTSGTAGVGGLAVRQSALVSAPATRRGAVGSALSWIRQHAATPTPGDQTAQTFADFLSSKVFTQANLESSDATSATFLLKGAVVCADPSATPAEVAACAEQIDALAMRIRATPEGDTAVTLEFMFGDQRVKPVTIALTRTPSLAVTLDLAAAKSAVGVIGAALGTPVDTLPAVMSGVVTASMKVENETKLTVEAGVSQAIAIRVDGSPAVSIAVAAVSPLARMVADSASSTVELTGRLGALAFSGPDSEYVCTTSCTTTVYRMDASLGSASGTLLLRGDGTGQASFALDRLAVQRDGQTQLEASLAHECVATLGSASIDFTTPLDATFTVLEDAGPVTRHVTASGAVVPHDAFYDPTSGTTADYLELLAGAHVAVSGGTTLDATGPICIKLDTDELVTCPAF